MHGLETIRQLNELATQNAKGAAEKEIAIAEAVRKANGTVTLADHLKARLAEVAEQERSHQIILNEQSVAHLLDLVDGLHQPTTLETALAHKLRVLLAKENGTRQSLDEAAAVNELG